MVLNKADLAGFGAGGPMAIAHRRAADYRALTGVPTVPMIGLLATAALDDEMVSALRTLTTEPADLTSTDAFLQTDHRLPREVRTRLLDTLDRFGIAHAVLALGRGCDGRRRCRRCCVGSARSTGSSRSSRLPGRRCAIGGCGRRWPNYARSQSNPATSG